jgi:hypothetical protein
MRRHVGGERRARSGGIVAAGCTAIVAVAVIGTGLTHADPLHGPNTWAPWSGPMGDHNADAYWMDVSKYGATGGVAAAESMANTICTTLQNPKLQDAYLIEGMADGNPYKIGGVAMIVHAAEWHYCPQRY